MHIIATDDEQSALNVLMGAIKEAVPVATVHGFRNPLEALEFMKETKCEIAFLDIQMREMSGIILARKLKEIYPKVNIVFVTGYSQYANEAFALNASGYVYKLYFACVSDILRVPEENSSPYSYGHAI